MIQPGSSWGGCEFSVIEVQRNHSAGVADLGFDRVRTLKLGTATGSINVAS
jgi:hypothetical protein